MLRCPTLDKNMAKVNHFKACAIQPSWANFWSYVSPDLFLIYKLMKKNLLKFTNCFAGSADRTVKFWDLETFELIGSARREVSKLSESF